MSMVFETLRNTQVSLPVLGSVSAITAIAAGGIIFFLLRRKKSISLKI